MIKYGINPSRRESNTGKVREKNVKYKIEGREKTYGKFIKERWS